MPTNHKNFHKLPASNSTHTLYKERKKERIYCLCGYLKKKISQKIFFWKQLWITAKKYKQIAPLMMQRRMMT